MKKLILSAALLMAAGCAVAEKADSYKQLQIDYNDLQIDDVKQKKIAIGNVVITRGTLLMKAERAEVSQTPEGFQHVVLFGGKSKATFRQKRDGEGDQWVEGEAERIEYDEHEELVKMFSKARINRLAAGKLSDEVQGEFISYDSRKEFFSVKNTGDGSSKQGGGRGTMVIHPSRTPPPASAPAASAPAAPAAAGK